MSNSKLLRDDLGSLLQKHRLVQISYAENKPVEVFGKLKIHDSDGYFHGSFDIRIPIPLGYPYAFPKLYETSFKIPKELDRHIEAEGSCCVCILQEQYLHVRKGITIFEFVEKYAIPFFAGQLYFEKNGSWPNGEYAHGYRGVWQYYKDHFRITDASIILKWLKMFLENQLPDRNEKCVCGAGKFKKCHLDCFEKLELMGKDKLKTDLVELEAVVEK